MKDIVRTASEMWGRDLSARQIAEHLGVPRNTVLNWTHTHRPLFPKRTKKVLAALSATRTRKRPKAVRSYNKMFPPIHDEVDDAEIAAIELRVQTNYRQRVDEAFQPIATSRPARLAECDGCRWPVDDVHGAAALFCNAERPAGQPYCTAHRAMSGSRLEMV
ncbi:MAG: putative GcrA cell cycle regulator [Prokaryotic dsDNA virus sp.]|nr:MAG: putative GcrA cell cycle regulator [Prokaryotic dsDNA virus sp.]|tara:strand:- start:4007 stop:4492 length:486 start_codon:yes stop_codon:yes gene_type:complete